MISTTSRLRVSRQGDSYTKLRACLLGAFVLNLAGTSALPRVGLLLAREAFDQFNSDWVTRAHKDYRNCRGGLLYREGARRSVHGDGIHLQLHQFRDQSGKTIGLVVRKAPLDREILAFDVAKFAHTLRKRPVIGSFD